MLEPHRQFLALDDGAPVGSAGSFAFQLSLPGGEARTAGVTMVGVLADHRRRGLLRDLLDRLLADARDHGDALAALWSTKGDLYGRFGFGLAALAARIDAPAGAALRAEPVSGGRIRLVDPVASLDRLAAVHARVRTERPGMIARTDEWWRSYVLANRPATPTPLACAVLELDAAPVGYALYRQVASWQAGVSTARLEVVEALGASPAATADLWRFLLGLDLVERVRALHLPDDHPVLLLAREPARLRVQLTDALWVRVLDPDAALTARSYRGTGEIVVEVVEPAARSRRWSIVARDGKSAVERTSADAELRLTLEDLGAIILGGTSVAALGAAGRTEEVVAGARERADLLFASAQAPWCPEEF